MCSFLRRSFSHGSHMDCDFFFRSSHVIRREWIFLSAAGRMREVRRRVVVLCSLCVDLRMHVRRVFTWSAEMNIRDFWEGAPPHSPDFFA